MKEEIVQEIFTKLESMALAPTKGGVSDITVDCELLDAKMGSGEKKIKYEDTVLVDGSEKTVFLYEKTTEKSKSFSFGASGESSFQSGKTLMRHVKGTFMGTNGQVINYDFDLGEIPKSIKAIAEKNGFKFKTVIRRKSAQF
jgi:hypothetical protein